VDVKGNGGYVVAPPSIHPDTGTAYQWFDGYSLDDRDVLPLPAHFVRMLERKQAPSAPRMEARDVFALGRDILEAGRALQQLAPWRCEDYGAWVNVGMALSELGAAGLRACGISGHSRAPSMTLRYALRSGKHFEPGNGLTLASLFHWAGEFPFVDEPDRAHAVALLLLPFVRDMIPDPTPNHLIEAPCPGSGKGLLADVLMLPSLGRNVSLVAEARDDDEWRKRISAALREGRAAVQIDNVARPLISGVLAAALTAPVWTDRVLGYSEMFSTPVRCVWLTTANNPTMSTEIARRCIQIRLDPKMDRPWLREGFRHADLRAWATARRGELIGAALTLVQAWVAAGKPKAHVKPLGSYEHWSAVLGGILETAGIPGFLGNLMQLYERADTEGATWRRFVAEWWERFKDQEVKAADLFPIALDMDGFDLGKGKTERAQKIAFGKALGRQRDRVIGQYRITQTGTAQRIALWQLQNVEQAEQEVYVVYNGVCSVPSPTPQNESSGFSDRAPDIHEHTQHTCQDADEVVLI
jgi:hypothetical protein